MVSYIHASLRVNVIVRLAHPRSEDKCHSRLAHPRNEDSLNQETFSALSADNQTRNYDTVHSNHHPSPSTLRSKGLSRRKMI